MAQEKVKKGVKPKRGPKGTQSPAMDWLAARMEKKEKGKRESTKYSSAYVRALVEEDEPTKKEAKKAVKDVKRTAVPDETKGETIEFEQKLKKKTPKKKYFGGKSKPEDVDVPAAIAHHKAGIKAAGQEGLKKLAKEREKAEQKDEAYRALGHRIDEILPALAAGAARGLALVGRGAATAGKVAAKGAKKVGSTAAKGAKKVGREAVQAGAEGVATAVSDRAKKRAELKQQGLSDEDLEEGYKMNNYVKALIEGRRESQTQKARKRGERIGAPAGKSSTHTPLGGDVWKRTAAGEKTTYSKKGKEPVSPGSPYKKDVPAPIQGRVRDVIKKAKKVIGRK